jgi:spore germination protein YaaH
VLCYFGLTLTANAALTEPVSWVDLQSETFATFLASAKQANDETLLTVSSFTRPIINALTKNAKSTAPRLAGELAPLVTSMGLSGVDIDIEGRWRSDRAGFVTFMDDFSKAFRSADPQGVILLDTYPQSAATSSDFFDLKKLTPDVDQFLVMEYAMESVDNASANSPVFSPDLGLSAVQTLMQYKKIVPSSKIVLGLPFYGYDFSTLSGRSGAETSTPDPEAVNYQAITTVGRPALWDPVSETPFTRFLEGTQWHETWYDDPVSLALKVALAMNFHEEGVGVWALGMEGGDTAMLYALDGGTAPLKGTLVPTPASAPSP